MCDKSESKLSIMTRYDDFGCLTLENIAVTTFSKYLYRDIFGTKI